MQNKIHFEDWYTIPSDGVTFPLKFVPHDGYYPLLAIPALYKGTNNPYFTKIHTRKARSRVGSNLYLRSVGSPFIYKASRSW